MGENNSFSAIFRHVPLPRMVEVRQTFERQSIPLEKIRETVYAELSGEKFRELIKPGQRICITAGSRGICNIVEILRSLVCFCKDRGAQPFIVPAMGSHAGATAEGQLAMLEHLGITEDSMGCPILSSMETVNLGTTESGYPVHIDKNAFEADGIIACGRVKLHTAFRGDYESGIVKMLTIGLGKQKGASTCHSAGYALFPKILPEIAFEMLERAKIIMGFAILENAYDETYQLTALTRDEIKTKEPELLRLAASKMARIMTGPCDVLIIDEMGKNISGEGSDPNVAGTFAVTTASGGLQANKRACLSLTPISAGNALGIGALDVISRRLYESIDFAAMYPNVITTHEFNFGKIPVVAETDRDVIQLCLYGSAAEDPKKARMVRIKNTLELEKIYVSEAMIPEISGDPNLEIIGEPIEFRFDEEGRLMTGF